MNSIEQWLQSWAEDGVHSRGTITLRNEIAASIRDQSPLRLCHVPLLALAGAVEGGASTFCFRQPSNVVLQWDCEAGPSLQRALHILRLHKVDFQHTAGRLSLPPAFENYGHQFLKRGCKAPITVVYGNRVFRPRRMPGQLEVRTSSCPSLSLIDRGVEFRLPMAVPGLSITAWIEKPLNSHCWPASLQFDERLRDQLRCVLYTASKSITPSQAPL